MNTAEIFISSRGQGMQEALEETEKLGLDCGLDTKENLRLRLLAEELFGMVRSIVGDVEGVYQVKENEKHFDIRLNADVSLTREMRNQLISVSTEGKNAASKGFMGKLKDMISIALLPKDSSSTLFSDFSLGLMSIAGNSGPASQEASANAFYWSMNQYKQSVRKKSEDSEDAMEAWDELEKSIVANIADEVTVCIKGSNVDILIQKAF